MVKFDEVLLLFARKLITKIFLVGFLLFIGTFGFFEWEPATINAFVIIELFYLFNCRSAKTANMAR